MTNKTSFKVKYQSIDIFTMEGSKVQRKIEISNARKIDPKCKGIKLY